MPGLYGVALFGSDDIAPEHPTLAAAIGQELTSRGLNPREIATIAGFAEPSDNTPFRAHGLSRALITPAAR